MNIIFHALDIINFMVTFKQCNSNNYIQFLCVYIFIRLNKKIQHNKVLYFYNKLFFIEILYIFLINFNVCVVINFINYY